MGVFLPEKASHLGLDLTTTTPYVPQLFRASTELEKVKMIHRVGKVKIINRFGKS